MTAETVVGPGAGRSAGDIDLITVIEYEDHGGSLLVTCSGGSIWLWDPVGIDGARNDRDRHEVRTMTGFADGCLAVGTVDGPAVLKIHRPGGLARDTLCLAVWRRMDTGEGGGRCGDDRARRGARRSGGVTRESWVAGSGRGGKRAGLVGSARSEVVRRRVDDGSIAGRAAGDRGRKGGSGGPRAGPAGAARSGVRADARHRRSRVRVLGDDLRSW